MTDSRQFFGRLPVEKSTLPFSEERTTGLAKRGTAPRVNREALRPQVVPGLTVLSSPGPFGCSKQVEPTIYVPRTPARQSVWKRWDLDGGWDIMALEVLFASGWRNQRPHGFYYFFDIDANYEELRRWNSDFREHLDHLLLLDPIS